MASSNTELTAIAETMAATEKVFQTSELIEMILVRLDFFTLLFVQRVSHAFLDAVAGSPSLQKKLFFKPAASFQEIEALQAPEDDDGAIFLDYEGKCIFNLSLVTYVGNSIGSAKKDMEFMLTPPVRDCLRIGDSNGCNASFANMYISQPPVQSMVVGFTAKLRDVPTNQAQEILEDRIILRSKDTKLGCVGNEIEWRCRECYLEGDDEAEEEEDDDDKNMADFVVDNISELDSDVEDLLMEEETKDTADDDVAVADRQRVSN
jgi:hypothetical protein